MFTCITCSCNSCSELKMLKTVNTGYQPMTSVIIINICLFLKRTLSFHTASTVNNL